MRYLEHTDALRRELIVGWYSTGLDLDAAAANPEDCEIACFLIGLPKERLRTIAEAYFKMLAESVLKSPHAAFFIDEWIGKDPVGPYHRFMRDLVSQIVTALYRWEDMPALFLDGWCWRVAKHVCSAHGIDHLSGAEEFKAIFKR